MAGIDVGGDTSVMWHVDVDNLRSINYVAKPGHPAGHRHIGIDETDPQQYFTISLEVPADATDKNNLASALQTASVTVMNAPTGSGVRVSFPLRIEDHNMDQIQIRWNSRALPRLTRTKGRSAGKRRKTR